MATPNGPWERGYEAASFGEGTFDNPYILIDLDDGYHWAQGWLAWHALEELTVGDTCKG